MFLYCVYFAYIFNCYKLELYIKLNFLNMLQARDSSLNTLIMVDLQCKTGNPHERIGTNKYSVNM